jgi:hypothetical protein
MPLLKHILLYGSNVRRIYISTDNPCIVDGSVIVAPNNTIRLAHDIIVYNYNIRVRTMQNFCTGPIGRASLSYLQQNPFEWQTVILMCVRCECLSGSCSSPHLPVDGFQYSNSGSYGIDY